MVGARLGSYRDRALPETDDLGLHSRRNPDAGIFGSPTERRLALERDAEERLLARQRALSEQTSLNNGPVERIRVWERLHALQLPKSATHPLLAVIARETELTLPDIHDEQQRRRATVVAP
jgi:hypothetical protein